MIGLGGNGEDHNGHSNQNAKFKKTGDIKKGMRHQKWKNCATERG
jgi:hypothetical protein